MLRPASQLHITEFSTLQNNPQHLRVLANEMFATRLGLWLGLPMPRVEVIEVSDWLITNTPDMRVDMGGLAKPCSSGSQLASLHPDIETPVFDYLPENLLTQVTNLRDYARCVVLDKWTGIAMDDRRSSRESHGAGNSQPVYVVVPVM